MRKRDHTIFCLLHEIEDSHCLFYSSPEASLCACVCVRVCVCVSVCVYLCMSVCVCPCVYLRPCGFGWYIGAIQCVYGYFNCDRKL